MKVSNPFRRTPDPAHPKPTPDRSGVMAGVKSGLANIGNLSGLGTRVLPGVSISGANSGNAKHETSATPPPVRVGIDKLKKIVDGVPNPDKVMSHGRLHSLEKKLKAEVAKQAPQEHPSRDVLLEPRTLKALAGDAECRAALQLRFDAGTPQDRLLIDALVNNPAPAGTDPQYRHADALSLANALRNVTNGHAPSALALLEALRGTRPEATLEIDQIGTTEQRVLHGQRTLNRLRRTLAETPSGMDALWRAEGRSNEPPAHKEGYRDALHIAGWLEQAMPGGLPSTAAGRLCNGSVQSLVQHARMQPRVANDIGADNDHGLQLAHKALLYADAKSRGNPGPDAQPHLDAYVAWSNNHRTSGRGTEFNQMLSRLNKYHDLRQRALAHGDRSAGNLLLDAGRQLKKMVGVGKDPLTTMVKHGDMGVSRGFLHEEINRYRDGLRGSIDSLSATLDARCHELRGAMGAAQREEHLQLLTRRAILQEWRDNPLKGFKPDLRQITAKVSELDPARQPIGGGRDEQIIKENLGIGLLGRADRLHQKTLESWVRDAYQPPPELRHATVAQLQATQRALAGQAQPLTDADTRTRQYVDAMLAIAETRAVGKGGKVEARDAKDLFQVRDLGRIVMGRPRQGIDDEHIDKVLQAASRAYDELSGTDRSSWGLNTGVFNGSAGVVHDTNGAISASSPIFVTPTLRVDGGRETEIKLGDASMGYQFFMGTASRIGAELGGAAGYGLPLDDDGHKVAAGFGSLGASYDRMFNARGVAITVPRDRNRDGVHYQDIGERMTHFMTHIVGGAPARAPSTQQAASRLTQRPPPEGRNGKLSNQQLWKAFVQEFGDDSRVSIAWVDRSASTKKLDVGAGAVARIGANGWRVGPSLSVGYNFTGAKAERHDESGRLKSHQYYLGDTHKVVADARLATLGSQPMGVIGGATQVGLNGQPILGIAAESTLMSNAVALKLVEEDGKLCPDLCYRDVYFQSGDALARYLNVDKQRNDKWSGVARMTALDGRQLEGADAVEQFQRETRALSRTGKKTFGERQLLDPAVARQIDTLSDQIKMLGKSTTTGNTPQSLQALSDEKQRLEKKRNDLFTAETSWSPKWAFVSETNAKANSFGWDLGPKALADSTAAADRILTLLDSSRPGRA